MASYPLVAASEVSDAEEPFLDAVVVSVISVRRAVARVTVSTCGLILAACRSNLIGCLEGGGGLVVVWDAKEDAGEGATTTTTRPRQKKTAILCEETRICLKIGYRMVTRRRKDRFLSSQSGINKWAKKKVCVEGRPEK